MNTEPFDTKVPSLGEPKIPSPIHNKSGKAHRAHFVDEADRVLLNIRSRTVTDMIKRGVTPPSFELAGPRRKIYFDPSKLRCALVTCGGLCPGINDIIRAIVLELFYGYGVQNIYGIRFGLQGFIPKFGHEIMDLRPETVVKIHEMGGTILGSSRGPQPVDEIVDSLERMNVGLLFMIGGDGTLRAATAIADAIMARGLKISVVGIPKTIDNDIHLVSRSFGFHTAVDVATNAIKAGHNESEGFPNGIGLIKLMGRHSGFIACTATLAQQDVNFVLIPEVDFDIDGPNGFLAALEERLRHRGHAVIVVAEGAGQKFFDRDEDKMDASGNIRLKDIGLYLKDKIIEYFSEKNFDFTVKYIDPSYTIRSLRANANDNVFCSFLGRDAVHAGMTGKTKLLIGRWNEHFVHVPMSASVNKRKQVDPNGKLWNSVLEANGQEVLKADT
ncbi:MAG: ATP-dependent 6-phosphofructokinase [Deltaproteobacteria bacterium]|nr:ATP-dependent 6-phosphofructokinase [Deltaproteobacteria bacterium]